MYENNEKDYGFFKGVIGSRVQEARQKRGMTQETLAQRAGLTRATIAEIEKGKANPSLEALMKIAGAFEISPGDFFSGGAIHGSRCVMQPVGGCLYDLLTAKLDSGGYHQLHIQTAYAKSSGVDLLTDAFQRFSATGGTIQVLVGVDQRGTTAEALYKLWQLASQLYVVHDHAFAQTYHPKVYTLIGDKTAWMAVGSGNLTRGGLCANYEAFHIQDLDLTSLADQEQVQAVTDGMEAYSRFGLLREIRGLEDIQELLRGGLIATERQVRQTIRASDLGKDTRFGHRPIERLPIPNQKVPVPAGLFAADASDVTVKNPKPRNDSPDSTTRQSDSLVTATDLFDMSPLEDERETFWFEMRASTGGSRNILDLSSTAKLQAGTHPGAQNGVIPGSVTFFGVDPGSHQDEKNITVVYNGIPYYPSTVKYAPNNASWRIQLKGDAQTGGDALSQYGVSDFAHHILVFHRITPDHYILETMDESELPKLKRRSTFWATNGNGTKSKAFGKI